MVTISDTSSRKLVDCAQEHGEGSITLVKKRIGKNRANPITIQQRAFLNKNALEILIAKPQRLYELHEEAKDVLGFSQNVNETPKNVLCSIFNYDAFINKHENKNSSRYTAYTLAENLNVVVCPYCNLNFTHTVTEGKNKYVRPDFDHFFPKSRYPLLALSFYNLIPCCSICNSRLKGDEDVSLATDWHPYLDDLCHQVNFYAKVGSLNAAYGIETHALDINVEVASSASAADKRKLDRTIEMFKLQKRYELHKDHVGEILAKHYHTSGTYLQSLKETFSRANLSTPELYRIAFANYHETEGFYKRPLSKFTADIVKSLNFDLPSND